MQKVHTRLVQPLESDPLFSGENIEFNDHEQAKPIRPMRRLILCLDGSWQSSNHGEKNIASNIAKLSRSIASCEKTGGEVIHQIVYYDAGVGTGNSAPREGASTPEKILAKSQKVFEGSFGRGVEENVCEAYNFLVSNWLPGDEIFIFGFSRGAYTARAVAGMVCNMGICFPDMMDDWWAIYDEYKKRVPKEEKPKPHQNGMHVPDAIQQSTWGLYNVKKDWKDRFYKNVEIQVVGVFDTVGALGWPSNKYVSVDQKNETKYGFHDTNLHKNIKNAFHALALDEHRQAFPPTLWSLPKGVYTKLVQCWFPGYHINIGGGSESTMEHYGDMESMANLSLVWMIDQIRKHTNLTFETYALAQFYHHYTCTIVDLSQRAFKEGDSKCHIAKKIDPTKWSQDVPDPKNPTAYGGWGMGYRPDSIDSVTGYSGSVIRTPGQYKKDGDTKEFIHPVVAYAMGKSYREAHGEGKVLNYQPAALKGFKRVKDPKVPCSWSDDGLQTLEGWYWRKQAKGVKYADTSYLTCMSNWYNASWPPEEDQDILIPEMDLCEDDDSNIFNERDYMRADWLALRASLVGFPDNVHLAIQKCVLPKDNSASEDAVRRENMLLNALKYVTERHRGSSHLEKSLIYALRRTDSTGLKVEEKLKLLEQTGDRTRKFLESWDC
ncbi:hypothetical protein LT330_008259 [Penicillium expansum]|uniref:T6SS Phospholipase effector Tle1-like catalytic domain-containing protein n=1 Tax=Penicillium expansum TaxID=27334 RepID=A0A0A2K048_PENEN|nr:protein of unknown function DUF2235 [Penicillium expansum]KAK4866706.1 hypothetical protein LT330_008259 [Penicillium expansum]KGO54068.1 protein of unknown function DUF2235 [Penicillium expansum]KGO60471.1 protein of unknown function DUF2235 [Penicillium expansum]